MGFMESSIFLKASLIVIPVALLFQLIALPSLYWLTTEIFTVSVNVGLWRRCIENQGCDKNTVSYSIPDWWDATRTFAIIGVVALVISIVLVALCLFLFNKEQKIIYIVNLIVTFIGGISILLSIIIFAAKYDTDGSDVKGYDLGWSYALSVVSSVIALGGGGLLVGDFIKGPSS